MFICCFVPAFNFQKKPQSRDVYFVFISVLISDTFSDYLIPLLLFIYPRVAFFFKRMFLKLSSVCVKFDLSLLLLLYNVLLGQGKNLSFAIILFLFHTDDVGSGTTKELVLKNINENVIVISVSYQCFVTTTLFLLS